MNVQSRPAARPPLTEGRKLLFVGPFPPPHGGVSVHLANARQVFEDAGFQCAVLNVEPRAAVSPAYIKISNGFDFGRELLRHAWSGWTFHVHTNGHNPKSWLIAFSSGLAARNGSGGVLTLHSGMLPEYLAVGATRRALARLACLQYERIVCVNPKIAETIASLGIPAERIDIMAAFLPPSRRRVPLPESLEQWFKAHDPVVSTALFFRPEYGVEILIRAIARIREQFPRLGCLIMGSGPDQMAAEMHIEDQGLTGSFRLQGDVDHDLCLAAIGQSALFVRPTFEDGDSISVREALALGVPVVASAVGTRPEGVHLFERGNAEALAAEMIRALSSKSAGNGPAPADPSRRLFEILENVSQCPI